MSKEMIIFCIYIVLVVVVIVFEIYSINNDKANQIRWSIEKLAVAFSRNEERLKNVDDMSEVLLTFYKQYVAEHKKFAKLFPNYIAWLDAVIYRVDTLKKIDDVFIDNSDMLKKARCRIANVKPYYQCSNQQGKILCDISGLKNDTNGVAVDNILERVEREFIEFNEEKERNRISSKVSTALGITGIIVSIAMGILSML